MFCPTITRKMAVRGVRFWVKPTMVPSALRLTAPRQIPSWKPHQSLISRRCLTGEAHSRLVNAGEGDSLIKDLGGKGPEEGNRKEPKDKAWPWGIYAIFGVIVVGASTYGFLRNNRSDPPEQIQSGSIEWLGKAVPPYTLADVDALFKENASSWSPDHWMYGYRRDGRPFGVERCDGIMLKSNEPSEDQMVASVQDVEGCKKGWLFWGVFDGHNGSAMSLTLKESLIPYVVRNVSQLYRSFSDEVPPSSTVDIAISSAFRQLDNDIMEDGIEALSSAGNFTETVSRLAPFFAGSCALLSIYDPSTHILRTACTGDSRAVLGRLTSPGKYVAEPLSVDQTGFNALELEKLTSEHPGENNVVDLKSGRVLGIAVSRAFGDGLWKWPIEIIQECQERYFWKAPRPGYKSPPYLTADPVITSTKIEGGEFLILASDGLWDNITSEQAVRLVELWLIAKGNREIGKGEKSEHKKERANIWAVKCSDGDFVVEDENCAAHLVRNAFGGRDHERLLGLAGAKPPFSRSIRDDVTVQVVFFKGVNI